MTDLREMHVQAEAYIERGWPIIPIPPENGRPTKRPVKKEWQNDLLEAGCATSVLHANWNIGLLLRDLSDVDLDCPQARGAASEFLPPTGLIYGHASSPASHRLYRTTTPLPYKKFKLADDDERGAMLELRSMSPTNGNEAKAFQSVLPPSIHPDGDRYEWNRYEEAAQVDGPALWRAVHLVAITTALAKLHPPLDDAHKTARDEFRLAISGVLARRLPEMDARKVFLNALEIAGDHKDRQSIFTTTLEKLRGGQAVKGIPALKQLVGDAVTPVLIWIDAIAEKEPQSTAGASRPGATAVTVFEDEEEKTATKIPTCPLDALEGDYIGDMMHALVDGTFIPPIFVRENIKTILGAVINGKVGLRSHPNIHTRHYHMMISDRPQSGKAESWERTGGADRGFLHDFLKDGQLSAGMALDGGIEVLDGGLFGSGEFMAALLSEPRNRRSIAWFDEMSELFEKDKAPGSIIEKKLLQLFESETISHGSFKNKQHVTNGVEFSYVGCFTKPSFLESFTGQGSGGSGLLSRNTFSYSDRMPYTDDWIEIDTARAMRLRAKIAACLSLLHGRSGNNRYIVEEDPDAARVRREVTAWIETLDDRYRPRLADHMKRDLILRALFSSNPVIDVEKALRAKIWLQNQYENRFVLWPEDAGSNVERMEQIILRALNKAAKPLSDNQLALACHAHRPGSGGFGALNMAILALERMHQIKVVGKTRKSRLMYGLV